MKVTSALNVSDQEFRLNIVRVAVSTRRWPSEYADCFENVMMKSIVYNRRDA